MFFFCLFKKHTARRSRHGEILWDVEACADIWWSARLPLQLDGGALHNRGAGTWRRMRCARLRRGAGALTPSQKLSSLQKHRQLPPTQKPATDESVWLGGGLLWLSNGVCALGKYIICVWRSSENVRVRRHIKCAQTVRFFTWKAQF